MALVRDAMPALDEGLELDEPQGLGATAGRGGIAVQDAPLVPGEIPERGELRVEPDELALYAALPADGELPAALVEWFVERRAVPAERGALAQLGEIAAGLGAARLAVQDVRLARVVRDEPAAVAQDDLPALAVGAAGWGRCDSPRDELLEPVLRCAAARLVSRHVAARWFAGLLQHVAERRAAVLVEPRVASEQCATVRPDGLRQFQLACHGWLSKTAACSARPLEQPDAVRGVAVRGFREERPFRWGGDAR